MKKGDRGITCCEIIEIDLFMRVYIIPTNTGYISKYSMYHILKNSRTLPNVESYRN